jgi:small conductance mechanosensitive channel
MAYRFLDLFLKVFLCFFILLIMHRPAMAQTKETTDSDASSFANEKTSVVEQIKVQPVANDRAIDQRLTNILQATGWFSELAVLVDEGVVFLNGKCSSEDYRTWAGTLAGNVTDVVAVVNRIDVIGGSPWDFSPAISELSNIWRGVLQSLPRFGMGAMVFVLVVFIAKMTTVVLRKILEQRLNPLLRDVAARIISILVFLLGFYLALQVAGLSWLSATVLGGTGIAGLVAGIAFRDLLENYLASILISIRNPFRIGDLVEISSHLGIVERVTTRGTVLMNQDGNHVQIPNSIVYKTIIRNFTANPNRREIFEVGIGYDSKASHAQEVALKVLREHPAVLTEPELLVLVDQLGSATVNLKVYFWYDGARFNGLKVKSSLIRLVKQAFERENISMPDEAREILFPEGVPVHMTESTTERSVKEITGEKPAPPTLREEVTTDAEGELASEELLLRDQARSSRVPEQGESLLKE